MDGKPIAFIIHPSDPVCTCLYVCMNVRLRRVEGQVRAGRNPGEVGVMGVVEGRLAESVSYPSLLASRKQDPVLAAECLRIRISIFGCFSSSEKKKPVL